MRLLKRLRSTWPGVALMSPADLTCLCGQPFYRYSNDQDAPEPLCQACWDSLVADTSEEFRVARNEIIDASRKWSHWADGTYCEHQPVTYRHDTTHRCSDGREVVPHGCDVDAMWRVVDADLLWTDWYCPDCDARWFYNRFPGGAEGRWYTAQEWSAVIGRDVS